MRTGTSELRELARTICAEAGTDPYTCYHAPRYALALRLVRPFVRVGETRALDIGPSRLTELIHRHCGIPVDSLGFEGEGATSTGHHYTFDLNFTQDAERWRNDLPAYGLIVMGEVIEHLHTSPTLVLRYLRSLLAPSGVLLIQTPNAVALTKRVKLLVGMHPYEKIREDPTNPGHFREYTAGELSEYSAATGFEVLHRGFYNYFDFRFSSHTGTKNPRWLESVKYRAFHGLPPSLRPGLTLVLRRGPNG